MEISHKTLKRLARDIQRREGCSYMTAIKMIAEQMCVEPEDLIKKSKEKEFSSAPCRFFIEKIINNLYLEKKNDVSNSEVIPEKL